MTAKSLKSRIDAAAGRVPCDLTLKNAVFLDVFSLQWKKGDISIYDGVIVAVEPGLKAKREVDLKGKSIVPGFVDAHVHLESSLMTPPHFQSSVLGKGTTTAVCDPHELANVVGLSGIEYFLNSAEKLDMDLWVMLSSCVPATHLETNGGGTIDSKKLATLVGRPRTLGLAEMMNVPGVLNADPDILEKINLFEGRPLDGHCPLVSGQALSTYAVAGISSCHESSRLDEAQEKLSKGVSVWIREGSVAKDLKALYPLLNVATSTSLGFCTDDRNPLDIAVEGHLDHLVRETIRYQVPAEVVYRTASWSVARHYGLNNGPQRIGAIAPGYQADLVILNDVQGCVIQSVIKKGIFVSDLEMPQKSQIQMGNTIRAAIPEAVDFEGPVGRVHTIGVIEGKIITDHRIQDSRSPGVAKISVLERYGHGSKPANGYVEGFGVNFRGAIASSVGHDSHNLIAVGSNSADMRVGMAALAAVGGGFAVVKDGAVLAQLPLPFGGLMSEQSSSQLKADLVQLKEASRSIGCELHEPFLQLAFLSLPVIPSLKITDKGLVDVQTFQIISVSA